MTRFQIVSLVIFAVAVFCWTIFLGKPEWLHPMAERLSQAGYWGMVGYGVIFAIATIIIVPAMPLAFGAGFLFGPFWGTLVLYCGSIVGGLGAFLLGRHLISGLVSEMVNQHPKFAVIDEAINLRGTRILALVLASPLAPFRLFNYGVAITRISVWQFLGATALAMVPHMFPFAYFGSLAKGFMEGSLPSEAILIGVAVTVALFGAAALIAKRAIKNPPQ